MRVYRLQGARQASYGIGPTSTPGPVKGHLGDDWSEWITLRESFKDYSLSVELGRGVHRVAELPDNATEEQQFDMLAHWEQLDRTWAQQQELYAQYAREEEEDDQRLIRKFNDDEDS
jgi:hypothetical protein